MEKRDSSNARVIKVRTDLLKWPIVLQIDKYSKTNQKLDDLKTRTFTEHT